MGHKKTKAADAAAVEESRHKKRKLTRDADADADSADRAERKRRRRERKAAKLLDCTGDSKREAPFKLKSTESPASHSEEYAQENRVTVHLPAGVETLLPVCQFEALDIDHGLRPVLEGFTQPTPIQAYSWPALLRGHDVVGVAETGSGKTLAFGLPALNHAAMSQSASITVLVIAPTRELAIQTHDTLVKLGAPFNLDSVCVYGGVDKGDQCRRLQSPTTRFLVGTPGRLLDFANEGACDLSQISYLVLDEADRMLDRGFENDIRAIISRTRPDTRQTLMFSATWPESVKQLANTFLRDPVRIVVGDEGLAVNPRVQQVVEVLEDSRAKQKHLTKLLQTVVRQGLKRILVFVLYKKEATRVELSLRQLGYSVAGLHGDLAQGQRLAALESFKEGRVLILVATDVAARGLDIPNVELVINVTFPLTIEDYVHRIGRTARGGSEGKSITFFTGEDHERALAGELARILRENGYDAEPLKRFPMTVKKKQHGAYGSFFREDVSMPAGPQKIKF